VKRSYSSVSSQGLITSQLVKVLLRDTASLAGQLYPLFPAQEVTNSVQKLLQDSSKQVEHVCDDDRRWLTCDDTVLPHTILQFSDFQLPHIPQQ
jgi:hypothetical protein